MDTVKIKAPFVIDAFGDLIFFDETIDYYPYGETRLDNKAGAFNERHKYTGYEFDATTGLNYAGARYQTPLYGRFISQDPAFWKLDRLDVQLVDPQSWNSYAYARNNPVTLTDENGEFWMPVAGGIIIDSIAKIVLSALKAIESNKKISTGVSISVPLATPITMPQMKSYETIRPDGPLDYNGGERLRSSDVFVDFYKTADNKVNTKLSNYFKEIMKKASQEGIKSVFIHSTTDHTSNEGVSLHEIGNGARAYDISKINDVAVSSSNPFAKILQDIVHSMPGFRENFGPFMIEHSERTYGVDQIKTLTDGHKTHIHTSVNID